MRSSFDDLLSGHQAQPSKVTRVLLYPNITYQRALSKDSYVQVATKMVRELGPEGLWWYVPLTERLPVFEMPNVTQWEVPLPTYPNTMRVHFDAFWWKDMLGPARDFDVVFSHLPEHTLALMNVLYNTTHHRPLVFGYSHWFEFEEVTKYLKNLFPVNVLGLLEMERCFVNTEDQRQLVLEESSSWFNDHVLARLERILEPFRLGVDAADVAEAPRRDTEPVIVFNHRPQAYKHFPEFVEAMDRLYERRKDFRVWVPLLGESSRPYMYADSYDKEGYYRHLSACRVGVSPAQVYRGWSVATTDGLMNGTPFVMYDAPYYRELWGGGDFFADQEGLLSLLERYLDNPGYRTAKAEEGLAHIRANLLYRHNIDRIRNAIQNCVDSSHAVRETAKGYQRARNIVREQGRVSKKDLIRALGWGRGIPWTPYRRRLMEDPNIYDVSGPDPEYVYVE